MYTLSFDGLYREIPNPTLDLRNNSGLMCYGWLIYQDEFPVAKGHGGYIHHKVASSNGAEYLALIEGLKALLDMGVKHQQIIIVGDAKTVIEQMQGLSDVNSHRVINLYKKAKSLCQNYSGIQWVWVPRKENRAADWLTRHALEKIPCQYSQIKLSIPKSRDHHLRGFMPVMDLMIYQRQSSIV